MINLIANTDLEKKVYNLLLSFFGEKKLRFVKIVYSEGKNSKLELYLDKLEGRVTVDECAMVTREVSSLLEVEDIIKGAYRLEISSPGIDRSLTRLEDFFKYKNFKVKIFKKNSSLRGVLVGYSNEFGSINNKDGVNQITLSEIQDIKLALDKLSFENLKKMESL